MACGRCGSSKVGRQGSVPPVIGKSSQPTTVPNPPRPVNHDPKSVITGMRYVPPSR